VTGLLVYLMMEHTKDSSNNVLETSRPMLLRSLFILGLVCEHFECEEFCEDVVRRKAFLFILHHLTSCLLIYSKFSVNFQAFYII